MPNSNSPENTKDSEIERSAVNLNALLDGFSRDAWSKEFSAIDIDLITKATWRLDFANTPLKDRCHSQLTEAHLSESVKDFSFPRSFIGYLNLDKDLAALWLAQSVPSCNECAVTAEFASLSNVLKKNRSLFNETNSVVTLTLALSGKEFEQLTVTQVLTMFNADSLIIDQRRVRASQISELTKSKIGAYKLCEVILWSSALPLKDLTRLELEDYISRYGKSWPELRLKIFRSNQILASFPVGNSFYCPKCMRYLSSDLETEFTWRLGGKTAKQLSVHTLGEFRDYLDKIHLRSAQNEQTALLKGRDSITERLNLLVDFGFADYEISHPTAYLSKSEFVRLKLAQFFWVKVNDVKLVVSDFLELFTEEEREELIKVIELYSQANSVSVNYQRKSAFDSRSIVIQSTDNPSIPMVLIPNLPVWNTQIDRLTFPLNKISALRGHSGSGKSEILKQLSKYSDSKFASQVLIGQDDGYSLNDQIFSVLGLDTKLATLLSYTREARRLGLTDIDLNPLKSKYRCSVCNGRGFEKPYWGNFGPENCSACLGLRFSGEINKVEFRGQTLQGLLSRSLTEALSFFEGEPGLTPVLESCIELGLGSLTLGGFVAPLSSSEVGRLSLIRRVISKSVRDSLVLVDGLFIGVKEDQFSRIYKALTGIIAFSNTLILTGNTPYLLQNADYMILLQTMVFDEVPRRRPTIVKSGFLVKQ